MQPTKLTFPVVSFRHLETPFQKHGYRDYFAMVEVDDLPDLSDWRKINVRDPKLTGAVPQAIRQSVRDNPELFAFMNRGIVLSVESAYFDNKTNHVTLTLRDPALHGLLDGGHTYNILLEEREALEDPQYVRLEILEGFKPEEIPNLVDARNTSNQVRDQSLMNLSGEFDKLKKALSKTAYANQIAYKEYETLPNGEPKPIDVRDIVAILTAFEREHFDEKTHPINAYRSKAACLQHFQAHKKSYEKLYPLAPDILELYDLIQLKLPDLYNKVRGGKLRHLTGTSSVDDADSKVRRGSGKFGGLTGVTTYKGKRQAQLYFIDKESKYGVPAGFTYPVLGGFRALLREKGDRYVWGKNLDPRELLENGLGETLADTIGNFALDARNPSKTGKSPLVWQACYQAVRVVYLTAK
jgi:hypothetical protein